MKCISLWQPWATLVAIGAKQYETRHWSTGYRGLIAIHAAKKWDRELYAMCLGAPFGRCLAGGGYADPKELPFGAIVAVARLTRIYRTENIIYQISDQERAFGDYSPGRYAWQLEKIARIDPLPFRGQQGLWELGLDDMALIGERLLTSVKESES